jgi:drug/metabolite transporter (DMT)-like permease
VTRARRAAAAWSALPGNLRGAVWIVGGCAFGLAVVLPFVIRRGAPGEVLRTRRLGGHLLRAVLGLGAMLGAFYALTRMPLADAVTLTFTQPLFTIPLAAVALGERIPARRWAATAAGFVGVVIMVGPSGAGYGFAAVVALAAAFLIACVRIQVKRLVETERPLTILLYFGLFSSLLSLGPALAVWRAPSAGELVLLFLVGALGALGQTFAIRGLSAGEASAVMPFDYTRLLFATAFGYALFADLPGPETVAGAAVIVASTLFLGRSEMRGRVGVR